MVVSVNSADGPRDAQVMGLEIVEAGVHYCIWWPTGDS